MNILEKICNNKIEEIKESKRRCSHSSLEKIIVDIPNRKFKDLIINSQQEKKNNIIGEIKKSSPSAGILLKEYSPEDIAAEYEKNRIGAISILTDNKFFNGSLDHISLVNLKTKLPIIRKDFIIDEYQILESKVYKADAILLILSILTDEEVKKFIKITTKYKLDCIIEAHNSEEINRAIKIGYPIIGINNRNLKNLNVNSESTLELSKNIPKEFTIVAESGIKSNEDIKKYNNVGIYNFLIGESILKSNNISEKIKELLN